ncbi:nicotinate phosphoribosyltransferase [Acetobacteraceae bacterium]|nr:nicotinate phosphoribosyltransferase [Acetobacteraceae bacterium]
MREKAIQHSPSVNKSLSRKEISAWTDSYFNRTSEIVASYGDSQVTYAFFLRRPSLSACRLALTWLQNVSEVQGFSYEIEDLVPEGEWVGGGDPIFYLTGSMHFLAPLETLLLQKIGAACVAAHNAFQLASELPKTPFLAMDARHCAGNEMQEIMAYAASVGGLAAKKTGAKGFIGSANNITAPFFGCKKGVGTMPHALIGYAGSTLEAAKMFHKTYPDENLVILVDYFGREISDAIEVAEYFPELVAQGRCWVRLDTHGGRFLEGLDPQSSYAVIQRHTPDVIRRYRSERELQYLVGTGVSAAAIWKMREALDAVNLQKVKILGSSGFNADKCIVMRDAKAPLDAIGTGSFLPATWSETYATADIVKYDGVKKVKIGREFLLR